MRDGWQVHALDPVHPSFPDAALAAELVIVHMLSAPEIEAVIRLRRARGLSTIFEISDNFLDMGGWLPARHALRNPLVRQRIVYHASIADAVQVYSPGLAALCRHVHPRILQLDPYVPLHDQTVARGDEIVIGWGGSTSHRRGPRGDRAGDRGALPAARRCRVCVHGQSGDGRARVRRDAGAAAAHARVRRFHVVSRIRQHLAHRPRAAA